MYSKLLLGYSRWFGLKQYKWLNLGSFPPLPLYLPLPPLPNTQNSWFTIYSCRAALASPTHYCSNLKHMQGKRGRGVCGREVEEPHPLWSHHLILFACGQTPRKRVCYGSFQYIHAYWSKYMLVSYCLTHFDFGTIQFLDHDGGKTNREKCLKSDPLMLDNK